MLSIASHSDCCMILKSRWKQLAASRTENTVILFPSCHTGRSTVTFEKVMVKVSFVKPEVSMEAIKAPPCRWECICARFWASSVVCQ
jgi:hypothetical protein